MKNDRSRGYVPGGGMRVGDLVELLSAGDWRVHGRDGTVVKTEGEWVRVRLGRTGHVRDFLPEELTLAL